MHAVYVLNEEPFYMTMACFSLKTLRQYNPTLPVTIYFVEDNRRDSRTTNDPQALLRAIKMVTKEELFSLCKSLNVNLQIYKDLDLKEETGYFSMQRIVFRDCLHPTVLLLDADTFIFGDVTPLFEIYKDVDFASTTNTYGDHYFTEWNGKSVRSFNSGVVIFNNQNLKKYADVVYDYCLSLKKKIHPLSQWLWSVSQEATGREELAFTLFALDNNLKYAYFDPSHVQKENWKSPTKIYHTLTHNWLDFYVNHYPKILNSHNQPIPQYLGEELYIKPPSSPPPKSKFLPKKLLTRNS